MTWIKFVSGNGNLTHTMTEKEMITMIVDTLPMFYYEKMVGLMMSLLPRRWWFCEGVWFKRQREIDHNIWKCSAWLSLASFEWNKSDPRFVAMVKLDNNMVVILDIRRPTTPFMVLSKHITRVNAMPWCSQILGDICALLVMMQGPSFGRWWT